jgi:putative oxidoreductase
VTTNLNHRLARYAPAVLSLFRLVYGLLFAAYGSMILFSWPVRPTWPFHFGAWPGWYAGLLEFVAGLLIASGLFTRAAAFIASGEMAVAYFWMHQPRSLWPICDPRLVMAEFWRFSSASVSSCWSSRAGGAIRSTP